MPRCRDVGNCLFHSLAQLSFYSACPRKSRLTAKVYPFRLKTSPAGGFWFRQTFAATVAWKIWSCWGFHRSQSGGAR
jgi:hypothetical protein